MIWLGAFIIAASAFTLGAAGQMKPPYYVNVMAVMVVATVFGILGFAIIYLGMR